MNNEDAESVPSIGPRAHYCSGVASLSLNKKVTLRALCRRTDIVEEAWVLASREAQGGGRHCLIDQSVSLSHMFADLIPIFGLRWPR